MIYFKYLRGASFGSIFRSEYKIKILSSEIYQGYSTCQPSSLISEPYSSTGVPADQNLQLLHAALAWLLGALLCRRRTVRTTNN